MVIVDGNRELAEDIARLIMRAMTLECCMYFCGEGHTPDDFLRVMTMLVERDDSQYSYRNTLCAMEDGRLAGIIVAYDGGRLRELRKVFLEAAMNNWGKDHSAMPDETEAGEYYIDSLAVKPGYERRGIGTALIRAAGDRADALGLKLGLLMDDDNLQAETFYHKVGFRQVGTNSWGGHPMKHLVYGLREE